MPTITKSIGTSSRDYSTITLWEADLDNGAVYAAGDVAVGEGYNDSAFDEVLTINGGGTVGLASRTLSVASGQRHNGTAGTGARFVMTSGSNVVSFQTVNDVTVEWWEINANGQAVPRFFTTAQGRTGLTIQRNILHDISRAGGSVDGINLASNSVQFNVQNNVIYDLLATQNNAGAICNGIRYSLATGNDSYICNNTVDRIVKNNSSGTCYGISILDDVDMFVYNNIACNTGGTTSGTKADYEISSPANQTADTNQSSDATAPGTTNYRSVASSGEFVSTTDGSEDYHLKTGANAIDNGTDLVTTPTGVNFDIDNRDRDAMGDTWDIGADEFVAAVAGHPVMRRFGGVRHAASLSPILPGVKVF